MKKINKFSRSIRRYWGRSRLLSYLPLVAFVALVWFRFRSVLIDPCAYLFANSVDGLKNYFNLAHYLKHDKGLLTSGFNYPYGDHLFYTDSHPLWALMLKQVDNLIPIAPAAIGIINYGILIGALLGALLTFRLLRRLDIPIWVASLSTYCIILLSPQWDRMGGHLSLSYLFVVPGILLLILSYNAKPGVKWALLTGLYIAFTGGLHAYYLPLHLLLILGFVFCHGLMNRDRIWQNLPLVFAALIPLFLFQAVQATDVFNDRATKVYGFFTYTASPASILMPRVAWAESLPYLLFKDRIQWEGRAYLGLPVVLLLLSTIVLLLRSRKSFWKKMREALPPSLISLLGASSLLLAFSMCLPFRLGMEWLLDILSPLGQIRALGRFAWPFYYVAGIIAVYFYHALLSKKIANGRLRLAVLAISLLLGSIWIFESTRFFLVSTKTRIQPNTLVTNLVDLDHTVVDAHQAILPLPLTAIGTDKLTRHTDASGLNAALPLSYETGLSIVATMSPRTSHQHALSAIQLISNPLIRKERLSDMDARPLLLVFDKRSSFTPEETSLLHAASPLYDLEDLSIASLPMSAFAQVSPDSLALYEDRDSSQGNFLWLDYDSLPTPVAMIGNGALAVLEDTKRILDFSNDLAPQIELSFWVYIDPDHQPMPHFLLEASDRDVWSQVGSLKVFDQTDVWKNWVRISFQFDCPMGESIRLTSSNTPFIMDNLLLRPAATDVLLRSGEYLIYNNFLLTER